jgi:hypothetical protein
VVLYAAMELMSAPKPALGAAPWLLVLGAYLFFSSRTLAKLGGPGPVFGAVAACLAPLGRLALGQPTWSAIQGSAPPGGSEVYRRA